MKDETSLDEPQASESPANSAVSNKVAIALVIAAIVAGLVVAKMVAPDSRPDTDKKAVASLTAIHNNAVTDYESARRTGRPVYVLFHSLS